MSIVETAIESEASKDIKRFLIKDPRAAVPHAGERLVETVEAFPRGGV